MFLLPLRIRWFILPSFSHISQTISQSFLEKSWSWGSPVEDWKHIFAFLHHYTCLVFGLEYNQSVEANSKLWWFPMEHHFTKYNHGAVLFLNSKTHILYDFWVNRFSHEDAIKPGFWYHPFQRIFYYLFDYLK